MDAKSIQKAYHRHSRELWVVEGLILVAGLAAATIFGSVWPVVWAVAVIIADLSRVRLYKTAADGQTVSEQRLNLIAWLGMMCQSAYLILPIYLMLQHDAHLVLIAAIMTCGGVLRQTHEFSVSRTIGLANWLPYVTLPNAVLFVTSFGAPTAEVILHLGIALAMTGFGLYCLMYWSSLDKAERSLEAARLQAVEERDAAAQDAALSQLLFNSSAVIATLYDTEGRVIAINAAGLVATGKPKDEVIGKTVTEIVPNCPETWPEAIRDSLRGIERSCQADRLPVGDGSQAMIVDWVVRPWFRADGSIGGAASHVHDVTLAARAREAEMERQQRLELALKASKSFIWEVDYAAQSVEFDNAAVEFFGAEPSFELFTEVNETWIHPEDLELRKTQAKALLKNGGYGRMEHRHLLPDGSTRWVRTDVAPAAGQDPKMMTRFVMLTRDVTPEMELQEQLADMMTKAEASLVEKRALIAELTGEGLQLNTDKAAAEPSGVTARQLTTQLRRILSEIDARDLQVATTALQLRDARAASEAASLAKSQFLANMSHELRTPLNAIIGYTEIIQEDVEAIGGFETTIKDAEKVRSSAHHLLKLINEILDLSKIEAGRMEVTRETVDISDMVADLVDTSQPLARVNGNALTFTAGPTAAFAVTDGFRLRQCLLNLISNACKFTSRGTVSISIADRVSPGEARFLDISVADTGIGIEPEALERLFKPFSQADDTTTRKFGGTGLGLALTRDIAQLLGGDVSVESTPGQGSRFTLSIPAMAQAASVVLEDAGTTDATLVLLVEDDAGAQALARHAASVVGVSLAVAETVTSALEWCDTNSPALILLDLDLPDGRGTELLTSLRADSRYKQVPIVVISVDDDRQATIGAGASDHLPKPCPPGLIASTMIRYLPHLELAAQPALAGGKISRGTAKRKTRRGVA